MMAETIRIHPDEPEPALIDCVVSSLNSGHVVALPTDTFYGLAVDPVNLRAVDRIYEIKTRARHKPLSLLISETAQAYGLAREIDTAFDRLAERFWPGPLTIIVKAGARLPLRVTANTGNVALRVPEAPIARAVVDSLGLPITATSAN
ncbi:MAG: L-threonylcarbamoyladenylate synthase, partial [Edaphobacter sp.]